MNKILLSLLPIFFITACNAKPDPKLELDIQARFLPTILAIDGATYYFAAKEKPSDVTRNLYDSAMLKAELLKKYDEQASSDSKIEKTVRIDRLNSLCLMSKFILTPEYNNLNKNNSEYNLGFKKWMENKQKTWIDLLKNEPSESFDYACIEK